MLLLWNTVSGNKPNRCEYEQLSPVEGNNNRTDRNKKNGKNKNERHRRFGSIDNDGNGNDDDSSESEDASSQEDEDDSGNSNFILDNRYDTMQSSQWCGEVVLIWFDFVVVSY